LKDDNETKCMDTVNTSVEHGTKTPKNLRRASGSERPRRRPQLGAGAESDRRISASVAKDAKEKKTN